MRFSTLLPLLAAMLLLASSSASADAVRFPPENLTLGGNQGRNMPGAATLVDAQHDAFDKAVRFEVPQALEQPWQVQLRVPVQRGVAGEASLELWARGPGKLGVFVESNSPPFRKSLKHTADVGADWTRLDLPFTFDKAYAAGDAAVVLTLGFQEQTLEVGGMKLTAAGDTAAAPAAAAAAAPTLDGAVAEAKRNRIDKLAGRIGPDATAAPVLGTSDAAVVERFVVAGGERAKRSQVAGPEQTPAVRIEVTDPAANPWSVALQQTNAAPIRAGDRLLLTFAYRGGQTNVGGSVAEATLQFKNTNPPWSGPGSSSLKAGLQAGDGWKTATIPFEAVRDYPPGEANLIVMVGDRRQWLELADVMVLNFGRTASLDGLSALAVAPAITYAGREPDAPWRQAAKQRITEHRMAALKVRVVDTAGRPIEGATVTVRQTRHEFNFGNAAPVAYRLLPEGGGFDPREAAETYRLFNSVSTEVGLKWHNWARGAAHQAAMVRALQHMQQAGLKVHGHVLVWPGERFLPPEAKALLNDPAALRAAVDAHLVDILTQTRGLVDVWDVVNEPRANHLLMDVLGEQVIVEWFRRARELAPAAELMINENSILTYGGERQDAQDHYYELVRRLLEADAPIDSVGMQGHFDTKLTPPERLLSIMDRFAGLGVGIRITEFDIEDPLNVELEADYLRDAMTVVFSHPSARGFTMWGIHDPAHWKKNAPLFDDGWKPKPALAEYERLVFGEWWTRLDARTDAAGQWEGRVFKGTHRVTATDGDRFASATVSVINGEEVILRLSE